MIEADELARYRRHARAFSLKINDAEALAAAFGIVQAYEDALHEAVERMKAEGFSWRELARPAPSSAQALQQAHARWRHRRVMEDETRDTP